MGCFPRKPKPSPADVKPTTGSALQTDRTEKATSQGTLISKATLTRYVQGVVSKDYEIRETLALRPFYQLKKCIFRPTNENRVVKIVHKSVVAEASLGADQRLREIAILRQLDHPNITRLYETFEDKFRFYLVEGAIEGSDLLTFLAEKPNIAAESVVTIMRQLLATVDYIHSKGIILRGLSFDSLHVAMSDGTVLLKATDFSNAVTTSDNSGGQQVSLCTAPEICAGKLDLCAGKLDKSADLWSCGVIFHVLLFGKPPYADLKSADVLERVKSGDLSLCDVSELDADQRELLCGLLEKAPKSRWTCQQALNSPCLRDKRIVQSPEKMQKTIEAMRSFNAAYKLKDAIFTFLSFQAISAAETNELNTVFLALDRNGDGKVSREELLSYFRESCREVNALQEAEEMLHRIDTDSSGSIEYCEFLKSTIDRRKYISKQYLEMAFQTFDVDGNGKISAGDLKALLGSAAPGTETFIQTVIAEADFNKDGEVDLLEFQTVAMRRF